MSCFQFLRAELQHEVSMVRILKSDPIWMKIGIFWFLQSLINNSKFHSKNKQCLPNMIWIRINILDT